MSKPTTTKTTPTTTQETPDKLSCLDAAFLVLRRSRKKPLTAKALVERMISQGHWQTKGKTPEATLNAALHRDMATKGEDSRFAKAGRGLFTVAS